MNSLRSTKICLVLVVCILSKISSGFWHKFPTNRGQIVPAQRSSTSLSSSQLSWDTFNKDTSRNTQGLNEDWLKSLDVLEGKVEPLEISVEDLEKKYSKASKTRSKASFSLMVALPEVLKENNYVVLVNRTADKAEDAFLADDSNIVYVTAQELERKWRDSSLLPMGKPVDQFDVKSALLLFDEEEDEEIIGKNALIIEDSVFADASSSAGDDESSTGIVMSSTAKLNADLALRHQLLRASQQQAAEEKDALEMEKTEVDDGVEFIVTEDELKRLWEERAKVPWGMPNKEYNIQDALMLLDDDEDDDDDTEYVSALFSDPDEEEKNGFWNEYTGKDGQAMREALKGIYDELEDMTYFRPAWKKDRHILTPDIDTQEFMGDIMWSNTYMTQRIPANWEDPEAGEMSETYLSTSTMAWPGEEETDFNFKPPAWEILGLPIGPKYEGKVADTETAALPADGAAPTAVDWETFDFSEGENDVDKEKTDSFDRSSFLKDLGIDSEEEDEDAVKDVDRVGEGDFDPDAEDNEIQVIDTNAAMQKATPRGATVARKWKTPPTWLSNPEFANHVDYEVWSNYPEEEFYGADDRIWDEDRWMVESMQHVQDVTDLYLTNHLGVAERIGERKYWERAVNRILGGEEDCELEDIPFHLTPDKDRGVEYSDDIIEMKGKISLHPAQPAPAILFQNDSFTHNTELETMNKIGTIREQYEWHPTIKDEDCKIDPKVKKVLDPVLKYANHLVELKHASKGMVIFEYKGMMRHIVGVRESMMMIAKKCYPEIIDLRLETERTTDKFDR